MNKDLLKENRIHGDIMFPFGVYSISSTSDNNILDCHWHDELEFLLVTEGRATFQIDTIYYEVSKGQAILINSGEIHAGHSLDNSACSFCAVVFDPSFLCSNTFDVLQSRYIDPILKKQYELPKHISGITPWEKEVLSQLSEIIRIGIMRPNTYELLAKAHLYLILSNIIANSELSMSDKEFSADYYKTERIKTALTYIQSNYSRKISTKYIAAFINISEGHFCRLFKQIIKKTPIDYLNYYRINKAVNLLEGSEKKVLDVAMEVGFENFSYFISTFKRYMKCTPAKLHKK